MVGLTGHVLKRLTGSRPDLERQERRPLMRGTHRYPTRPFRIFSIAVPKPQVAPRIASKRTAGPNGVDDSA